MWRPSESLLGAARLDAGHGRRRRSVLLTRAGLLSLAAVQVAIVAPAWIFGGHDAARDVGAFDLALAAGFLLAAWHPDRTRGMRAIVGTAAALLLATAVVETASGRTPVLSEAPHLIAVVGWLLLHRLALLTGPVPSDGARAWSGGARACSGAAPSRLWASGIARRGTARQRGWRDVGPGAADIGCSAGAATGPAPGRGRGPDRHVAA
ncbi:MAG TPA: hypothetical protein VMV22_04655 [Acidimicrobiales bacterium]|nr:hypothetical protein [Acidimicrobiales bacterium]